MAHRGEVFYRLYREGEFVERGDPNWLKQFCPAWIARGYFLTSIPHRPDCWLVGAINENAGTNNSGTYWIQHLSTGILEAGEAADLFERYTGERVDPQQLN